MTNLKDLPNIGKTIEEKLRKVEIYSHQELVKIGSKNAIIKISTIENSGACIICYMPLKVQSKESAGMD